MTPPNNPIFKRDCQTHLQHLKLKGLQPKTIEAYARAIRRIGDYFGYQLHDLSEAHAIAQLFFPAARHPLIECR